MLTDANKKTPKNAQNFNCIKCDFKCCKKSEWDRHILTRKHLDANNHRQDANKKTPKNATSYECDFCERLFKHMSSLSRHKKKCQIKEEEEYTKSTETTNDLTETNIKSIFDKDDLIKYLLKENNEFKEMLLDQNKAMMKMCEQKSIISNSNINSNNKTFNLQFFLNETCKDAMNIMDFVESVKIQLSDLENVGKLGFVEGISNIIIKNLKALDVHKRPVHCSDSKREVMYIKDEDKWEKENEEKNKLRKAIKYVAHKNTKMLPEFKIKYPDYNKSESLKSQQYNKLVIEAMGGKGDNDIEKEDKIIKNIAKEVVIYKDSDKII